MFNKKPASAAPLLDLMIANAISEIESHEVFTDEYAAGVKALSELYKIKTSVEEKTDRVSKDQLLAVVGNLAGILAILGYERVHVISSKAIGFVIKAKS